MYYSQVELCNVKAELIEEKDRSASYKKKLLGKQRDLDWFHKEARELNSQLAAKREANEHLNQQLADLHQELASRDEVLSERSKDVERAMHRAKQSTDHCEPTSPGFRRGLAGSCPLDHPGKNIHNSDPTGPQRLLVCESICTDRPRLGSNLEPICFIKQYNFQ